MSQSLKIAKNTLFQFLSKFTTIAFALVTRKLLTSHLGPAGFGDYGLILAYVTFFTAVADWGTQLIGVREAAKALLTRSQVFTSVILLRTGLSLIAFFAALLFIFLFRPVAVLQTAFTYACFLVILLSLKASLGVIFDTYLRTDRWFFVEIVSSIITLVLVSTGVALRLPLSWYFFSLIISTSAAVVVAFFLSLQISRPSRHVDINFLKHFVIESLPMGSIIVVYGLYNRIDTFILKKFASSEIVGFYILAYLVYENLGNFASFFSLSSLPYLSSLSPLTRLKTDFQKIYDLLLAAGLAVAVLSFTFAPGIVTLLSSSQFAPAVPLTRWLAIALFFSFLNHATGYTLIAKGRQRPYLLISLLALAFNVILNFIFIPKLGAPAAAAITVLTEVFIQVSSLVLIFRAFGFIPKFTSFPKTVKDFIRTRGQIF